MDCAHIRSCPTKIFRYRSCILRHQVAFSGVRVVKGHTFMNGGGSAAAWTGTVLLHSQLLIPVTLYSSSKNTTSRRRFPCCKMKGPELKSLSTSAGSSDRNNHIVVKRSVILEAWIVSKTSR